jgi:hypothetical protein
MTMMRYFSDLQKAVGVVLGVGAGGALLLGFSYVLFLRFCAAPLVWGTILGLFLVLLSITLVMFYQAGIITVAGVTAASVTAVSTVTSTTSSLGVGGGVNGAANATAAAAVAGATAAANAINSTSAQAAAVVGTLTSVTGTSSSWGGAATNGGKAGMGPIFFFPMHCAPFVESLCVGH